MAYFANGSEGLCFETQCEQCRYGQNPCPIAGVQMSYNYEACNNEIASVILNGLVKNDGTCEMFKMCEKDFKLTEGEKSQIDLFT